jgi:hypothetical protein
MNKHTLVNNVMIVGGEDGAFGKFLGAIVKNSHCEVHKAMRWMCFHTRVSIVFRWL